MKIHTNLRIDEAIWRAFRAWCLARGLTASALVENFMKAQIEKDKTK